MTIVTIIDNSNKDNSVWWGDLTWPKKPLRCCDIWDTDYNTDNWEPEFMTIFVIWQLIVTLDSIRNSCDVFIVCLRLSVYNVQLYISCYFLFLPSPPLCHLIHLRWVRSPQVGWCHTTGVSYTRVDKVFLRFPFNPKSFPVPDSEECHFLFKTHSGNQE